MKETQAASLPEIDIREKGAPKGGQPQCLDRRMYFQLYVFSACQDLQGIVQQIKGSSAKCVLYRNFQDPYGFGTLFFDENPAQLMDHTLACFASPAFKNLQPLRDMTMVGRTYSSGFEPDLDDWLLKKPVRTALNPKWPWAVWYPLRRKPEFATLSRENQKRILMEHAVLGRQYGAANLAFDIRLACYGMDVRDNEFVIGVVSADLHPLSRLIQDMRRTEQTSKYIQSLGPFFVGKVLWQSPLE